MLRLRHAEHDLFRRGSYQPLYASGPAAQHAIAHARVHNGKSVLVAVPRFVCTLMRGVSALPLGEAWKDWDLPIPSELQGQYRNIFTGETVTATEVLPLARIFASYPVAVLLGSSTDNL